MTENLQCLIHLSQTEAEYAAFFHHPDHGCLVPTSQIATSSSTAQLTCEPAGFGQQEGAPGHEEEEGSLQQREAVQLGELSDVRIELKTQHCSGSSLITIIMLLLSH